MLRELDQLLQTIVSVVLVNFFAANSAFTQRLVALLQLLALLRLPRIDRRYRRSRSLEYKYLTLAEQRFEGVSDGFASHGQKSLGAFTRLGFYRYST